MTKPLKGDIRANAKYLKEWDDFQKKHKCKGPILLPISISIEDGIIARDRIKSGDIAKMRSALLKEFKAHCEDPDTRTDGAYSPADFKTMLDDYINAFTDDSKQGPRPPSPLDFNINRPVWFLFYLPRKNWKFTKERQYSMEHDRDDFMRNCEKVCTLGDNDILLLANHHRSAPKYLKYNLHVTIAQKEGGKTLLTDIIIDPGMNNGAGDGEDSTGN